MIHFIFIIFIAGWLYTVYPAFKGNLVKKIDDSLLVPSLPRESHRAYTNAFRAWTTAMVLGTIILYILGSISGIKHLKLWEVKP